MNAIRLPHGIDAPVLGLGTFQLEGAMCGPVVREALALGYRHLDTADEYGNEEDIGEAIRTSGVPRHQVFVVSKVSRNHLRPVALRRRLLNTLGRLGTDYLDLYLVHWPNRETNAEETADGLEELRAEGLIRGWGVSNYTVAHLEEVLLHARVSTNQVELHPYFRQDRLCDYCRDRGVPVTCYSPLARGYVSDDPVLREIAANHRSTASQIALAWSVGKGHIVIPKASSPAHLRENLGALDVHLSEDEQRAVDRLRQTERLFDYEWSEFEA